MSGLHPDYIGGIEHGERNVGVEVIYRLAVASCARHATSAGSVGSVGSVAGKLSRAFPALL